MDTSGIVILILAGTLIIGLFSFNFIFHRKLEKEERENEVKEKKQNKK